MEAWIADVAAHGYAILFGVVFLEAIGLPVPGALALLIAGAASARGSLYGPYAFGGAVLAVLSADTLMFLMGRYTGWWLLGLLCRISLNPEACILRSADSFYRRGRMLLLVAKFIPGINTMAPPLAGCMSMRLTQFLRLDLAGTALFVGAYFIIGFAFSDALKAITRGYRSFGQIVGWLVITAIVVFVGLRLRRRLQERGQRPVAIVPPAEAARALTAGACIYDVRSHGYLDAKAVRIRGSRRLDPNALNQPQGELPPAGPVFVYCTCLREATSSRVARELEQRGMHVAVIQGGLRAWMRAGLPVESVPQEELAVLPAFG
jgi:membrane protein DedA with SNARE-associated domain/rhodanese-related sulfurtransferase